jgi:hypothetical protein
VVFVHGRLVSTLGMGFRGCHSHVKTSNEALSLETFRGGLAAIGGALMMLLMIIGAVLLVVYGEL